MVRKTNLFYTGGPDSNFLTFSNYTELLTANFVSTNTKLFPSKFLCMYIPKLESESEKSQFIKNYLVGYYENKLATLRDSAKDNKWEDIIFPLSYLISTILKYDNGSKIVYSGDITEQDYNGTYTDTICTVNTNVYESYIILNNTPIEYTTVDADETLRGWYTKENKYIGPLEYNDLKPKFDSDTKYYINKDIKYSKNTFAPDDNIIKFNVLIPLFDMLSTDGMTEYSVNTDDFENESGCINCPLGIWFADKPIILTYGTKYGQSWSLVIGSQFKPLPTSQKISSDINQTAIAGAYNTFAQALISQNKMFETINELNNKMKKLENRLNTVEGSYNIYVDVDENTLIVQEDEFISLKK